MTSVRALILETPFEQPIPITVLEIQSALAFSDTFKAHCYSTEKQGCEEKFINIRHSHTFDLSFRRKGEWNTLRRSYWKSQISIL